MNKSDKFTVSNPPILQKLILILVAMVVLINIFFTVTDGPQAAMYISFAVFLFPFIVGMVWAKLFKVTVNGRTVSVRRGTGVKYSFDVSEITQVKRKIVYNQMGGNEKLTVKAGSKKFAVGSLMIGFDKLSDYIDKNVDRSKVIVSEKNLNRS